MVNNYAKIRGRDVNGKFLKDSNKRSAEQIRQYRHDYYLKNKERIIARTIEWGRANKDKRIASRNKWRESNRERTNYLTRKYNYRRKNAVGTLTLEQTGEVYRMFKLCPYCNTNKPDTLDHVIPLSRGGPNDVTNVVAVCRSCNSKKRDKTLREYHPILMMWDKLSEYA